MNKICKYFSLKYKWKFLFLIPFVVLIIMLMINNNVDKLMNEMLLNNNVEEAIKMLQSYQEMKIVNILVLFGLMIWAILLITRLGYIYERRSGSSKWRDEREDK